MADEGLSQGKLCQIALVVEDIEKASKAWAAALGVPVPPWSLTDTADKSHARYRGRPTEAQAKLAFLPLGQVTIELIEPVGKPSTWHDGLAGRSKVHHVAFHVADADQATRRLQDQGLDLVQTGDFTGGRYVYLDATAQLGTILELLADRPG